MSTDLVELPIIPGTIGPAVAVDALQTDKTLLVYGITGAIHIEASSDGVNFCPIATFSVPKTNESIQIECAFMRADARGGTATKACVSAETGKECVGVIPTPPANGVGDALPISNFGPSTTIFVKGINPIFGGSLKIELSLDGEFWSSEFKNFTQDGCLTEYIPARFIRGVATNAPDLVIGICSQQFGVPESALDSVAIVDAGNFAQLAIYDDEVHTQLWELLQQAEMILATIEMETN